MALDISHALLDHNQEIQLARRIEAGLYAKWLLEQTTTKHREEELHLISQDGEHAIRELFRSNLRLVSTISIRWARKYGLDSDELFQEGCLGLGDAIHRYDYQRGTRFTTVAWNWITQRVAAMSLTRCGQIDAPTGALRSRRKIAVLSSQLAEQLQREPSTAELAAHFGRTPAWIGQMLQVGDRISLDDVEPLAIVSEDSPDIELGDRLKTLSRLEKTVIIRRYGLDGAAMSVAALSQMLEVSQATVRRIEARAVAKMRADHNSLAA